MPYSGSSYGRRRFAGNGQAVPGPVAATGTGVGTAPLTVLVALPVAATGTGIGSANDALVRPIITVSTGTGVGTSPLAITSPLPSTATGSGAGTNPTVSTSGGVSISPAVATGTGAGTSALNVLSGVPAAATGPGIGTNATVTVAPRPAAATGIGAGSANDALIQPTIAAAAGVGVGVNPIDQQTAVPLTAVGAGIGYNAGITTATTTTASPVAAPGIGAGVNPAATGTVIRTVTPTAATGVGAGPRAVANVSFGPFVAVGIGIGNSPVANGGGQSTVNAFVLFETPHVKDESPWLDDSTQRQKMLMRHFENRTRGVSVWQRSDGTFCVDTPCNYEAAQTHPAAYFSDDPIGEDLTTTEPGLVDTNVNYPWQPFPGSGMSMAPGEVSFVTNWDHSTQLFVNNPYLAQWWQGGTINQVTQVQALVLTAAGFGDNLT